MSRYLTIPFLFALFAACSAEVPEKPVAPAGDTASQQASQQAAQPAKSGAQAAQSTAGYDDSDCNLETVLDPDKPGAPGHLIKSPRNPNGDSELAVLMRRFVEDLKENRIRCQGGEPVQKMFPVHRTIRCAWPTKPEERDATFDGRAIAYLANVRAFDEAPSQETYNAIVSSCVACHQVTCGGVIDFIETLRWE